MKTRDVWLFGNPDFAPDALPVTLYPELRKRLPQYRFIMKDPNEEWELSDGLTMIDTVYGITTVQRFTSLDMFSNAPNVTVHDFDALANLKWLSKLNRLPPVTIIGLPPSCAKQEALEGIIKILHSA